MMSLCRDWPTEPNINCMEEQSEELTQPAESIVSMAEEELNFTNDEIGSVLLFSGVCDALVTAKYHEMQHGAGSSWFDPAVFDGQKLTRIIGDPVDTRFDIPENLAETTLFKYVTGIDYSRKTTSALAAVDKTLFTADRVFNVAMPKIIENLFSIATKWSSVLNVPLITYRGLAIKTRNIEHCNLNVGDSVPIDNFTSTSISCNMAGTFMHKSQRKDVEGPLTHCGLMYKFLIPPHTKCIPTFGMHYYPEECEVILVPDDNVEWTVIGRDMRETDKFRVVLLTVKGTHLGA